MLQSSNFVIQIGSNRLFQILDYAITREELRESLYPDLANKLLSKFSWEKINIIQVPLGKSKFSAAQWRNLKSGDRVIVVSENRIELSLLVVGKFSSDKLKDVHPFLDTESNLFFIYRMETKFLPSTQLSRASSQLNRFLDAELPFLELDHNVAQVFLREFDLDLDYEIEKQIENKITELASLETLDVKLNSSYRLEQDLIRRLLLRGRTFNPCFFCGKELSQEHLVAAHIKQRSECSQEERLDFRNNVVLACKMGCDHLFELGYFAVASDGVLVKDLASIDLEVTSYLGQLPDQCELFDNAMANYFEWHYLHKFKMRRQK
jgi:hypothetical protein